MLQITNGINEEATSDRIKFHHVSVVNDLENGMSQHALFLSTKIDYLITENIENKQLIFINNITVLIKVR